MGRFKNLNQINHYMDVFFYDLAWSFKYGAVKALTMVLLSSMKIDNRFSLEAYPDLHDKASNLKLDAVL